MHQRLGTGLLHRPGQGFSNQVRRPLVVRERNTGGA